MADNYLERQYAEYERRKAGKSPKPADRKRFYTRPGAIRPTAPSDLPKGAASQMCRIANTLGVPLGQEGTIATCSGVESGQKTN